MVHREIANTEKIVVQEKSKIGETFKGFNRDR